MSRIMIDPPSGWRYGFPKAMPDPLPDGMTFNEWLVSEGYPQAEVDCWKNTSIPCRSWTEKEVSDG